jgi:hypothetical protein
MHRGLLMYQSANHWDSHRMTDHGHEAASSHSLADTLLEENKPVKG